MKTLFTLALCGLTFIVFCQNEDTADTTSKKEALSFAVVENIPVAPGCEGLKSAEQSEQRACMNRYMTGHVAKNFEYPNAARKEKVGAKIYVNFVIERDGKVSQVEVVRGAEESYANADREQRKAAKELDEEAVRVIRSLHFVEPAFQRGKPVRMSFTMPINAKL